MAKVVAVFKALLAASDYESPESKEQGVLSFSSENPKFKLNVYQDNDGNFIKAEFENGSEVDLKKLEAVVSSLVELFSKPAERESGEATGEGNGKEEKGNAAGVLEEKKQEECKEADDPNKKSERGKEEESKEDEERKTEGEAGTDA